MQMMGGGRISGGKNAAPTKNIKYIGGKTVKKIISMLLALVMVCALAACGGNTTTSTSTTPPSTAAATDTATAAAETPSEPAGKPDGSVNLTIMLALGQWTDNFDELVEAYKAENPQIGSIEGEFPSSSTYWDLLKSKLASGEMPDIFGCGFGEQIAQWHDYLADISDLPAAADLTPDQIAQCSLDGSTIQVFPVYVEGWGILYNMKYLNQVGWEKTPETRDELEQLCKDLTAAGIQPFMHHYAETSLSLTNHLGSTWVTNKEDPLGFYEQMKTGVDMDLANDPDLNEMLDYYDLVLQYGNADYISTDKWVGRNAFFLEEAAMIDDEGSWEIPNIMEVNPPLAEYVVQGLVPISNDAANNRLQLATINAAIYKEGENVDEAKKFLNWLCTSDTAQKWHQEKMGNIPALGSVEVLDTLSILGQHVFSYMQTNKAHETMTPWTPDGVKDNLGEVWSLYVGKQITREQFFEQYQKIWTDYAASK